MLSPGRPSNVHVSTSISHSSSQTFTCVSAKYFEYCLLHSGADLANMVNAAAIYAASEGDTSVTTRHLEFAKDKILMGKYFC